jgi:uroporphyrinogen decarboxylase
MNGRERVLCSLSHREADHVPLDIGGSDVTGIHRDAYKRLARLLGFREDVPICETFQQVALPDEALLQKLDVDVRPIFPKNPDDWEPVHEYTDRYDQFIDEWGVGWATPKEGGLYFDMISHPLVNCKGPSDLATYRCPDGANPGRFRGLREHAADLSSRTHAALIMLPVYGGIFESAFWLRGYKQFYLDLGTNPALVNAILDMTLEFRLGYWGRALEELGDLIDVVVEYDDLGHNTSTLISPQMYKRYLQPRHKELYSFIKSRSHAAVFLHSCGAIYPLIPGLIEAGIDILNPIQVGAANMGDTKRLKQQFGKDITFWGGGINSQTILPQGTPQQVKQEVRKRIEDLAPGGGFVFASVHNIQPDVPAENIMAMWEAWREYGIY